ncbi:hypothetical protein ACIQVL_39885 [Streptomyces sp. NPDC090499]|uniref:hypothetical protein n=1 Tax=Streptomyces sp. NPDC090499 TaxID=3365965 RepID=UPI0038307693
MQRRRPTEREEYPRRQRGGDSRPEPVHELETQNNARLREHATKIDLTETAVAAARAAASAVAMSRRAGSRVSACPPVAMSSAHAPSRTVRPVITSPKTSSPPSTAATPCPHDLDDFGEVTAQDRRQPVAAMASYTPCAMTVSSQFAADTSTRTSTCPGLVAGSGASPHSSGRPPDSVRAKVFMIALRACDQPAIEWHVMEYA